MGGHRLRPRNWRTRRLTPGSSLLFLLVFLVCTAPSSAKESDACLDCHGDASRFEGMEDPGRLVVSPDSLEGSVHGRAGLECVYCHQALGSVERFPHPKDLPPVNCGGCHAEEKTVYLESRHGIALRGGNPRAPSCSSCHGTHEILPSRDPRSSTHKVQVQGTCATCHGRAGLLTDQIVKLPDSLLSYTRSVHGRGVERGIAAAAGCNDCHEVHDLRSATDPASALHPRNQAGTCGKCHPDIELRYEKSIHGRAVKAGIPDSPTCTDCHGEHLILSTRDSGSKTYSSNLALETCGICHDDPVIIAKYRLRGGVVGSYVDSYHGWVTGRGYSLAATCVSCHTAHFVLPHGDPDSTVHPDNVAGTCAKCHKGATARFARSYSHETASVEGSPINRTIRDIYYVLIAVVIGGMVLHNLVVMNYHMIERRNAEAAAKRVLRFDRMQILQHLMLAACFVMLLTTGFALRFPGSWWARLLSTLGMSEPARGTLHRIFAVGLLLTTVSHLHYILFTRRGRVEFRAMRPSHRDFRDLVRNLRFHTWRTRRRAKFGRYDYTQKAEYWALIWGTLLMIFTGVILWFPEQAVRLFPIWIIGASQTIHYYEAWLAMLAVLVWHFFFVIFHPEEYPMSWTWLTGRMSEESVKRHHARWYEEEIQPGREEAKSEEEPAGREEPDQSSS